MKITFIILFIVILAGGSLFFLSGLTPRTPLENQIEDTLPTIAPEETLSPTPHPEIRLASPQPNESTTSPIIITGEARGTWFFEATFPIKLLDLQGNVIAENFATATAEEWMTEDFIPFSAELEYELTEDQSNETYTEAILVLQKDNPSDKRELDDEIEIRIRLTEKIEE